MATDGAFSRKQGDIGGWAVVFTGLDPEQRTVVWGYEQPTTNNRMEIQAVIKGLDHLASKGRAGDEITVICDSEYVVKCFTQKWHVKWVDRGWRTSGNQPVKNQDLWEQLIAAAAVFRINWAHTKGHAGNHLNELADVVAVHARESRTFGESSYS